MHHGQTRGERKTQKVCKTLKFYEIRGKFAKIGQIVFPKYGGKCTEIAKTEEIQNLEGNPKQGEMHHCLMGMDASERTKLSC